MAEFWSLYLPIISFLASDLIIGLIFETILIVEKSGAKFRWTLSPFKPYLPKEIAILIAIIQSVGSFALTYFWFYDFVLKYLTISGLFIYPISILVFATIYLTIREDLPYNWTLFEMIILALIYGISLLLIYLIITYPVQFAIYFPSSLRPPFPSSAVISPLAPVK